MTVYGPEPNHATRGAALHWDSWMQVSALFSALWLGGHATGRGLVAFVSILALHGSLLWFLPVEIWAAIKRTRWTLSYRVWDYPTWFRYLAVPWLGAMLGVLLYWSPLWALAGDGIRETAWPAAVASLAWAGIAGWLAAHFPGRGKLV